MNGFIIVIGYIMWIYHHYALFNTEQTFDPLPLIYHDKRQTNLSRATLRNRLCTCGVHTWWSWHKQHTGGWVVFSLYKKKEGATLLFFSQLFNYISIGHRDLKKQRRKKNDSKNSDISSLVNVAVKINNPVLLVTHSYSLKSSSSLIFNALDQSVLPMVHGKCALHGPVLENKFPFSVRRVYQGQQINTFKLLQCVSDPQF